MMAESSSLRAENSDPSLSLGRLAVYTSRPKPKRPRRRLPGRPRLRRGPKEVAPAGTVRLRSAMRQLPEPPLCPFFTHVSCVADRWADTRADDRALRPIADASGATASANERTST